MGVSPQSINLLHVDDEPDVPEMTAEFLKRTNDRISVHIETRASDGLDRIAENDYDCIISDYNMPGQNGIEFLETVREDDTEIPFILYTGKGSEEVASAAIAAGVTDYLQKATGSDHYELLANSIENAVEAAAAESELDETLARVSDAIYGLDSEWQFTFVNERAEELIERSQEAVLGKSIWGEFPAAADSDIEEQYRTAMETQESVDFTDYYAPLDLWVQIHAYPSATGLTVYFRDITEAKIRENALHTSLERFEALIEYSSDIITVIDEEGTIRYESPSIQKVLGYAPSELVGESAIDYVHRDDQAGVAETLAELLDSSKMVTETYRYRVQHKDGSWVWLESVASNRKAGPVEGYIVNSRDLTGRQEIGPGLDGTKPILD